jgi:MraZ protein
MFLGKFYHKLEQKGRLSIPKKFRLKSKKWVISRGLEGCLFLTKHDDFEKELTELSQGSLTNKSNRNLIRWLSHESEEVGFDKQGRVHLPEYLTKFAQLKKDVVVVGSFSRIEIWDLKHYHQLLDKNDKY